MAFNSIKRATSDRGEALAPSSAAPYLPAHLTLASLGRSLQTCRGCQLYERATQAVAGEGPAAANLVLIGEAPGDDEDKQGRPFMGPSGRLLDEVLAEAGIDRNDAFVTNAVKHFKWEPRGKRRLHAKPSARELAACRPWLEAELELVSPRVIVCLGATAAQGLLGHQFGVSQRHGEVVQSSFGAVVATCHPSAVLRAPDPETRQQLRQQLLSDLRVAVQLITPKGGPKRSARVGPS